jgi:protease II
MFRLTPILKRRNVAAIARVALNDDRDKAAVITETTTTQVRSVVVIDLDSEGATEINLNAYDLLWLDGSTLLISTRSAHEPRAVFSLRLGESPREIAQATHPGETLLLHSAGWSGFALIEHNHPRWSFFDLMSAANPLATTNISQKGPPGTTCALVDDSIFCSSFTSNHGGVVTRTPLGSRSAPKTIHIAPSGGSIAHIVPAKAGLAVITSFGSHATITTISSSGEVISNSDSGGPTTTFSPAPTYQRGQQVLVRGHSFLRPSESITIEEAPQWSQGSRVVGCDTCVERALTAKSSDGTIIPISLVTPKEPQGLLVKVYGSYGLPSRAEFSPEVLSLARRGVAVAIAHVRGGGELGPLWHSSAVGANKLRSVADLRASIAELSGVLGIPTTRIIVYGRSAGAWLAAKVATTYPNSFRALILEAPLVDLTDVASNPSLPLFEREKYEWGDSLDVRRDLSPKLSAGHISVDLLAMVPLEDELVPIHDTLRWLRNFQCQQSPSFRTIVSLIPGANHDGPRSRSAVDEWSAAQEIFIRDVVSRGQ